MNDRAAVNWLTGLDDGTTTAGCNRRQRAITCRAAQTTRAALSLLCANRICGRGELWSGGGGRQRDNAAPSIVRPL
jgi:hypothetical protein